MSKAWDERYTDLLDVADSTRANLVATGEAADSLHAGYVIVCRMAAMLAALDIPEKQRQEIREYIATGSRWPVSVAT